ncbi:Proline racemase [Planctomycetales bacterium 10988]|nr:Proline racemase [Planctomycetales bacterium 10988]
MNYIDSHTEGEPTRVIIGGGPDLGSGPLRDRLNRFREKYDDARQFAIQEPRGHVAIVGALLCVPEDPRCAAGVIFFNNTGYLGMCGHGTIGVAITLAYLNRVELGTCLLETPVGIVKTTLHTPNQVSIENVPSYRHLKQVSLTVPGLGTLQGDVAWGGNWFFLIETSPITITSENLPHLIEAARQVRKELRRQGITGANGAEIDHIEFCQPSESSEVNSRNFVFCPGGAYDRSPCGTGTSAKLACLAADGKLNPGETWVQESILGSRFSASYRWDEVGRVLPTITGSAYLCGEGRLIQQAGDPFPTGISTGGFQ